MKRLKIFIVLSAVLLSLSAWSKSVSNALNVLDANGKRTGFWVLDENNQPVTSNSDKKRKEGYYENGRKKGVWILYFEGGKLPRIIGEYSDNRPSGAFFRFDSRGELIQASSVSNRIAPDQSVQVKNDLFSCKMLFDNKDMVAGQVFFNRVDIAKNKSFSFWTESSLKALGSTSNVEDYTWLNSNYTAILTTYLKLRTPSKLRASEYKVDQNLAIKEVKPQVNNINESTSAALNNLPPTVKSPKVGKGLTFMPNGFNKLYTESNEIWMDGHFENGQLKSGKVFIYDKDGILLKVRVYKDGKYESDGVL